MTGLENSSSNAPNGLGSTEALVVSHLGGPFELKEVQLKDMRRDEIVVKMIATGICHTDLATAHVSIYQYLKLFSGFIQGCGRGIFDLPSSRREQ
jgi:hypothetical protein